MYLTIPTLFLELHLHELADSMSPAKQAGVKLINGDILLVVVGDVFKI